MSQIRPFVIAVMGIFCLALIAARAFGAPPENADPALAPWFESLQRPGGNLGGCCSQSDCRPVAWRITSDHYEALLTPEMFPEVTEPAWIVIPARAVLERQDNPTGRAILCWRRSMGALCFVRPGET